MDRGLRGNDTDEGLNMTQCYNCGSEMFDGGEQLECGCGAIVPKFIPPKECPLSGEYCIKIGCAWWETDKNCCVVRYLPKILEAVNIRG